MAWVKRLFVDEIDAIFKKRETETLQILTHYVLATFLQEKVNGIIFENCVGCKIDHPSQDQHICIAPDPDTDCLVECWYQEAADALSFAEIKEVITTTQEYLEVGLLKISPEFSFYRCVSEKLRSWKATEFRQFVHDLEVEDRIKEAVNFAKEECHLRKELKEKWTTLTF